MKILEVFWITLAGKSIGIVAGKNDVGQVKFYIAQISGLDEEADTKFIAEYGSKIDPDMLVKFIERNLKQQDDEK